MGSTHLVQAVGSARGRWSLEHRRGGLRGRGHGEMGPAVDISETRGDDIRVFYMSWVEGEQLECIGVLDIAEVGEAEGVDEITALGLVDWLDAGGQIKVVLGIAYEGHGPRALAGLCGVVRAYEARAIVVTTKVVLLSFFHIFPVSPCLPPIPRFLQRPRSRIGTRPWAS
jgi:hypothetical protein